MARSPRERSDLLYLFQSESQPKIQSEAKYGEKESQRLPVYLQKNLRCSADPDSAFPACAAVHGGDGTA